MLHAGEIRGLGPAGEPEHPVEGKIEVAWLQAVADGLVTELRGTVVAKDVIQCHKVTIDL